MKYSIIIPTYNEIRTIVRTISHIKKLCSNAEIIVADGGSIDGTTYAASELGAIVVTSEKGRGIQLNVGAKIAKGDIFLFLHSDTLLPDDAFEEIDHAFINDFVHLGTFRLVFDIQHWFLRFSAWFTKFDSVFTTFGDQCIVVRKTYFEKLNGFNNWYYFEDVEFLHRVRKDSFVFKFSSAVTTSARRYVRNGIYRQQIRNIWYALQYQFGAHHTLLSKQYNRMRDESNHDALIIFARYPVPGKVKTRLASSIGFEAATEFYRMCTEHIFSEVQKLHNVKTYLFFSDGSDATNIANWVDTSITLREQQESELGERMFHAFELVFKEGAHNVAIIGTDIPSISSNHIKDSFHILQHHDAVIGPSNDGGYYLLGLRRPVRELFEGISWSTANVFQQTTSKLSQRSMSYGLLPILDDIDTIDDLQRWSNQEKSTNHPIRSWTKNLFAQFAAGLEL